MVPAPPWSRLPSSSLVALLLTTALAAVDETQAHLDRMAGDVSRLTSTEGAGPEGRISGDDARLLRERMAQNSNAGAAAGDPGRPEDDLRRLGDLPPKRQQQRRARVAWSPTGYTNPDEIREEHRPIDPRRRIKPELPGDELRQRPPRESWRPRQAPSSSLLQEDETATPRYYDPRSGVRR